MENGGGDGGNPNSIHLNRKDAEKEEKSAYFQYRTNGRKVKL